MSMIDMINKDKELTVNVMMLLRDRDVAYDQLAFWDTDSINYYNLTRTIKRLERQIAALQN